MARVENKWLVSQNSNHSSYRIIIHLENLLTDRCIWYKSTAIFFKLEKMWVAFALTINQQLEWLSRYNLSSLPFALVTYMKL